MPVEVGHEAPDFELPDQHRQSVRLSDFRGTREVGAALRGTFVIDTNGIVRWKVVNGIPEGRDTDDYRKALADL